MKVIISLFAALTPAIFLIIYFYKKDKAKPEPAGLIVFTFILGIIVTIPIVILELILSNFNLIFRESALLFYLFRAFIVAALCEEGMKLTVVRLIIYRKKEFDEITDGIVYTITVSLGFAALENVLYVLNNDLTTALIRAVTAVPLHAIASGLMGYYLGKAKFAADKTSQKNLIKQGFFIAFLIHGYYNFVLFMIPLWGFIPALTNIPLLIGGFIALRKKIATAIDEDIKAGRVNKLE